ncbi:MAG: DNA polymerase III subunit alpha [Clostridia bacterium]|nr:DNA polymerase III subunit alpha [Clostridia bacterium]
MTQFTMTALEQLGLLKMDFLGLRTLTVIDDTVKLIRRREPAFSLDRIDVSDKATYAMLSTGKTDGVFQFESAGMRSVLTRLRPESLEDLIAVISLYRPGPADSIDTYINNRHHPEQTTYPCEQVKDILSVTYGYMVYQEQVMEICRVVAGYSYGAADLVRRAMAKKKWDVMEKERTHFLSGAAKNGVDPGVAERLFEQMSAFANYAFNKSHAAAYAFVSFQTAWLKCHYPCELMAATLTSVLDSSAKVASYIGECVRLGIRVLPPHVNESAEGFSAQDGSIRFGLLAIKNLGRGFIRTILSCRAQAPFCSFYDFCKRTAGREFNKRAVESLIRCGALDGLGTNRRQMLCMLPQITSQLEDDARRNIAGQIGFFDEGSQFARNDEPVPPPMEEFPREDMLRDEKEITGLYLSGHPMSEYDELAQTVGADRICDLLLAQEGAREGYRDGAPVKLFGLVEHLEKKTTKSGASMAFLRLEDRTGAIECLVFSKLYADRQLLLREGEILLVEGRLSLREEKEPTVVCDRIEPNPKNTVKPQEGPRKKQRPGYFVRLSGKDDPRLAKLRLLTEIFEEGRFPLYIFTPEGGYALLGTVEDCDPVTRELETLFGPENVAHRRADSY